MNPNHPHRDSDPGTTASIKLVITQEDKRKLCERNFTDKQIRQMTPKEVEKILSSREQISRSESDRTAGTDGESITSDEFQTTKAAAEPVARWAVHRRLYDWVLSFSQRPHATTALCVISFAESSFFPIPPDVLLGPLCLGNRRRSMWFATVTTVASVLGAYLGYLIGWGLWETLNPYLFRYIPGFTPENYAKVDRWYDSWGVFVLFGAAFTPLPFKVFTIVGGVMGQPLLLFGLISIVGRGLRFFLVASLFWWIGPKAIRFIDKYFNLLCVVFIILLAGGFLVIKWLH